MEGQPGEECAELCDRIISRCNVERWDAKELARRAAEVKAILQRLVEDMDALGDGSQALALLNTLKARLTDADRAMKSVTRRLRPGAVLGPLDRTGWEVAQCNEFLSHSLNALQNEEMRMLHMLSREKERENLRRLESNEAGRWARQLALEAGSTRLRKNVDLLINSYPTEIDQSGARITLDQARALAEAVSASSSLKTLHLINCKMGPHALRTIIDALEQRHNVKHLYAEGNNLGDIGAKVAKQAIEKTGIELLDLGRNNLTNECMKEIATVMPSSVLSILYVHGNQLADSGAASLAKAMESEGNNLVALDLMSNGIGDKGAVSLADAVLKSTAGMRRISLWGNVITDRGGVYLAEAVGRSSTMKEVELGGNQLSAQGKVQAHRVSNGIVNT